jgi:alpha-1,3-glucan synthase
MGKHLVHLNLIWVVPCINDINYPIDRGTVLPITAQTRMPSTDPSLVAEDIKVEILGETYRIKVQYHTVGSITFVLLDAPVFRKRTKAEPYPPRMDDLDSAICELNRFSTDNTALTTQSDYSAWNQCVAEALRRFDVDLYHINDYHATVAPLYLLPSTIPSCLSLHNAEFQGMWSLKSKADMVEICQIFNLPSQVVASYVQFGEVFNLLHAGASILRINQNGFGSVGVSKKYGKRAYARYPIFWGLTNIGALPNPDPSDFAAWDKMLQRNDSIHIDNTLEAGRGALRIEAQQWAGLNEDPEVRYPAAS